MTATDLGFDQPAFVGSWLSPKDVLDHLILVTKVHESFERYDDLAGKEKIHVRFDYVDLDSPNQDLVTDAINSHPGIALRLKGAIATGRPVLGRIGQEPAKKAGLSAAYVLGEFTAGVDDIRARDWQLAQASQVSQPSADAPAVAPPVQHVAPAPVPAPTPAAAPAPAAQTITQEQANQMNAIGVTLPPGTQIVG